MRYYVAMTTPDDIDPAFLRAISGFIGSAKEIEFERRGSGDSTYLLHGKVVAVDSEQGTIQIQRTRTSAGDIHEMGLQYFLSATPLSGVKLLNLIAIKRNEMFRDKQDAREAAVARASVNPSYNPSAENRRSLFVGKRKGSLEGFPVERYVYEDLEGTRRRVSLIAESQVAADKFMSMQDIFMPLDDMIWHAINLRVLWPAGIAFDRQANPSAWSLDWFKLFDNLAGIPKEVLTHYLDLVHSGRVHFGSFLSRTASDVTLLSESGLLESQGVPKSFAETLERVSLTGLRQLRKEAGSSFRTQTRVALTDELSRLISPALEASAILLMRPPRMRVKAPAGLTVEQFDRAVRELRDSIFLMRQWIRATREFYREDELKELVEVT